MSPVKKSRGAWIAALDTLESEVDRIETMLAASAPPDDLLAELWAPPAALGPIPPDLRARADAILARQLRIAHDLAQALGVNRRHAAFAAKVEPGDRGTPQSTYLDGPV